MSFAQVPGSNGIPCRVFCASVTDGNLQAFAVLCTSAKYRVFAAECRLLAASRSRPSLVVVACIMGLRNIENVTRDILGNGSLNIRSTE